MNVPAGILFDGASGNRISAAPQGDRGVGALREVAAAQSAL